MNSDRLQKKLKSPLHKKRLIIILAGIVYKAPAMELNKPLFYTLTAKDGNQIDISRKNIEEYAPGLAAVFNSAGEHGQMGNASIEQLDITNLRAFGMLFNYFVYVREQEASKRKAVKQKFKKYFQEVGVPVGYQEEENQKEQLTALMRSFTTASDATILHTVKKKIEESSLSATSLLALLSVADLWHIPHLEVACAQVVAENLNFDNPTLFENVSNLRVHSNTKLALLWYQPLAISRIIKSYEWLKNIMSSFPLLTDHNSKLLFEGVVEKLNKFTVSNLDEIVKKHSPAFKAVFASESMRQVACLLKEKILDQPHLKAALTKPKLIASTTVSVMPLDEHSIALADKQHVILINTTGQVRANFYESYIPTLSLFDENTLICANKGKRKPTIRFRDIKTGCEIETHFLPAEQFPQGIAKVETLARNQLLVLSSSQHLFLYDLGCKHSKRILDFKNITDVAVIDAPRCLVIAEKNTLYVYNILHDAIEHQWDIVSNMPAIKKIDFNKFFISGSNVMLTLYNDRIIHETLAMAAGHRGLFNYPYALTDTVKDRKVINYMTGQVVAQLGMVLGAHTLMAHSSYFIHGQPLPLFLYFIPEIASLNEIIDQLHAIKGHLGQDHTVPPEVEIRQQQEKPEVCVPLHPARYESTFAHSLGGQEEDEIMTLEEYQQRQSLQKISRNIV